MGALRNVLLTILAISLLTFVAFFGRLPGLRNTPIGFLHRVLWIHAPKAFRRVDQAVTGGRTSNALTDFGNYLFYGKHPLVLIFFLALLTGASGLFLSSAWGELSLPQTLWVAILLPQPYLCTYLCAHTPALQHITPSTLSFHLRRYPYDSVLYKYAQCRTCRLPKPARSKHCSLCNACVARADHHCVWVNNCVGYGNYKYFLALLLSTSVLLFYGAHLGYSILAPQVSAHIQEHPRWHMRYYAQREDLWGRLVLRRGEAWIDNLGTAFMVGGVSVGAVGLLAAMTAPLPLGLLAYHGYLIWAGTTTNESGKWADLRDDMADGLVWVKEKDEDSAMDGVPIGMQRGDECQWPTRSKFIVWTTYNGRPPEEDGRWRRVWKLGEVENIYDLGFWEALKDILKS